ncbi:MAG: hypothetical protein GXZ19_10835 [Bacteroidales bacterium]|nr:hypothetical protein [Bacteroidales bacterium]
MALADGENWENPDPGENGGDDGQGCENEQFTQEFEIDCKGVTIYGTNHSFSCKGSNGACYGTMGYEFTCGIDYEFFSDSWKSC